MFVLKRFLFVFRCSSFLFSLKVDKHFLLSVYDSLKDKVKTPLVDHSLKVVNALKLRYVLYKLNKLFIRILFVTHLSTYNSLWIYFWWAHTLCAWYWRWFKVRNKCSILRNITSWTEKCKLSVQNDCKNQLARVCQRKQSRRYYLQEEHERQLKLVSEKSICIRNNALPTRSN